MKRNYIHIIYTLLCTLLLSACIKNDIPYPRIKAQILGISADGQIGTAVIDNDKRMVTMELSDTVDLRRVHIETSISPKEPYPIFLPIRLSTSPKVTR